MPKPGVYKFGKAVRFDSTSLMSKIMRYLLVLLFFNTQN